MAEGREGKPHRPCKHVGVRWSSEHGGCLMFMNADGRDCCSVGEGEFAADALGNPPAHAARALETARQRLIDQSAERRHRGERRGLRLVLDGLDDGSIVEEYVAQPNAESDEAFEQRAITVLATMLHRNKRT